MSTSLAGRYRTALGHEMSKANLRAEWKSRSELPKDVSVDASEKWAVNEKRIAPRRRVLKTAFIIISEKAPKLECTVRNISETGAALQLSTTVGIPQSFELVVDGTRRHCRVQWRTDTKIGVMFI